MPFSDLQGILNAQFHTVSDLLTIIFLSENSVIQQGHLLVFGPDRSRKVGLSSNLVYSTDMSVILYLASGTFGDDTPDFVTRL